MDRHPEVEPEGSRPYQPVGANAVTLVLSQVPLHLFTQDLSPFKMSPKEILIDVQEQVY